MCRFIQSPKVAELLFVEVYRSSGALILQDTITGFLLAGVGNVDLRRKTNYLVVDSSEALLHSATDECTPCVAKGGPGMSALYRAKRVC